MIENKNKGKKYQKLEILQKLVFNTHSVDERTT